MVSSSDLLILPIEGYRKENLCSSSRYVVQSSLVEFLNISKRLFSDFLKLLKNLSCGKFPSRTSKYWVDSNSSQGSPLSKTGKICLCNLSARVNSFCTHFELCEFSL